MSDNKLALTVASVSPSSWIFNVLSIDAKARDGKALEQSLKDEMKGHFGFCLWLRS